HPKIVTAGVTAGVRYQQMAMYCMQHTTDGFVPAGQIARFGLPAAGKHVAALADVGLIERADGGWLVPGYVQRYPTGEERERRRQTNTENGKKGGRPRTQQKPKSVSDGLEVGTETEPKRNHKVEVEVEVDSFHPPPTSSGEPPRADDDDGELTTDLLALAGIVSPGPTAGELATVARLVARGWPPDQLRAMALRANHADVDPRAYLLKLLGEALNSDPATTNGHGPLAIRSAPPERRGLLDDQRQPCGRCAGSGIVGGIGPDGLPDGSPASPCPSCHVLGASA
ncbi:MAG: hypothetical protein ACRCZI_02470, partial [Cetobacterium sp.]